MAEQPSATPTSSGTTGRAVVMLLCLIALPLIALRGTTFSDLAKIVPEIIHKLADRRGQAAVDVAKQAQPEAPRFQRDHREALPPETRPSVAVAADGRDRDARRPDIPDLPESMPRRLARTSPDWPSDNRPTAPGSRPEPSFAPRSNELAPEALPIGTSQASRRTVAANANDSEPIAPENLGPAAIRERSDMENARIRSDTRPSATEMADVRRTPLVPVTRRDRSWASNASYVDSPPLQNAVIRPEAKAAQGSAEAPDRFTYVAERLRELGAVYYLLETWGSERFRFHCKMTIGGNPNYTRQFEATDRDPMQAMGKVLADVETWRAAR